MMWSFLLCVVVAALGWSWVRGARVSRLKWLSNLNLPGLWHWETDEGVQGTLELWGEMGEGRYRYEDDGAREQGSWRVQGGALLFDGDDGRSERCELRVFEDGKIGLDGPRRPRRVYVKARNNVVSLSSRRS